MLPMTTIEQVIRQLLTRYHGEYALLIGSYARGDATEDSDIDVVVFGGSQFKKTDIFAFAESTSAPPSMRRSCGKGGALHERR